jgi:hypothetical protein
MAYPEVIDPTPTEGLAVGPWTGLKVGLEVMYVQATVLDVPVAVAATHPLEAHELSGVM